MAGWSTQVFGAPHVISGEPRKAIGGGTFTPADAKARLALPAGAPIIMSGLVEGDTSFSHPYVTSYPGHKITTTTGTVNIADQDAEPTKPADKAVSFSTYGVVIPISIGQRRIGGNVLESSPILSRMDGTYDYYTEYQIPVTTTDETLNNAMTFAWDDSNPMGLDLSEISATKETNRVFQNNDTTSDNWVDVETYRTITLVDSKGVARTYTFTVS